VIQTFRKLQHHFIFLIIEGNAFELHLLSYLSRIGMVRDYVGELAIGHPAL
jgi:hypothetical protein